MQTWARAWLVEAPVHHGAIMLYCSRSAVPTWAPLPVGFTEGVPVEVVITLPETRRGGGIGTVERGEDVHTVSIDGVERVVEPLDQYALGRPSGSRDRLAPVSQLLAERREGRAVAASRRASGGASSRSPFPCRHTEIETQALGR